MENPAEKVARWVHEHLNNDRTGLNHKANKSSAGIQAT
jgi:hypothetical protein